MKENKEEELPAETHDALIYSMNFCFQKNHLYCSKTVVCKVICI